MPRIIVLFILTSIQSNICNRLIFFKRLSFYWIDMYFLFRLLFSLFGNTKCEPRRIVMKIQKTITILLSFIIVATAILTKPTAQSQVYSWYCVRESENKQPQLPSEFSFIEKQNVLWLNTAQKDNTAEKKVYLTFDAGYENGNIEKILNILKEKKVVGAFFILENLINRNPELVLRMSNEGHWVCNHTAHHKDMSMINDITIFEKELNDLNDAYEELTGKSIKKYYRPPEGKFSLLNLKYASQLGYQTVFWSFAYADWDNAKQPSNEYAKKKIIENIHNGAVILLHPTSKTNAAILGELIDEIRSLGYDFGTLDQLSEEVSNS